MDGLNFHAIHLSQWGFTRIKTHKVLHIAVSPLSLIYLILSERLYRVPHLLRAEKALCILKSIWEEFFKGVSVSAIWESKQSVEEPNS